MEEKSKYEKNYIRNPVQKQFSKIYTRSFIERLYNNNMFLFAIILYVVLFTFSKLREKHEQKEYREYLRTHDIPPVYIDLDQICKDGRRSKGFGGDLYR